MSAFKVFEIDPGMGWLRQVNLLPGGGGNAGNCLVQTQNRGTVEWWTMLPGVSLGASFTMTQVTPPATLGPPTAIPGSVTFSVYGVSATQWVTFSGTINPGPLVFQGTDPGTSNVWYMMIQYPTQLSDGWLKWFRPAGAPPYVLGSGTSMTWTQVAAPISPANYLTLTDVIPKQ